MRRVAATALIAFLAAGCTSDGSKGSPATAPASTEKAPDVKPAGATPAGDTIPTDKEKADARRQAEIIAALAGKSVADVERSFAPARWRLRTRQAPLSLPCSRVGIFPNGFVARYPADSIPRQASRAAGRASRQ